VWQAGNGIGTGISNPVLTGLVTLGGL
jgi:hypothetical protein